MFSGFRHISLTLLPKPFGKQKRWWIFNWNFTTELLRSLTEIDSLLFIDWNLNVLFSKYIMQVKESKSKQKCKFFHKPLAEVFKSYSFQRLPIIKKVIVITKSPQNRLWLKFTSRMVWLVIITYIFDLVQFLYLRNFTTTLLYSH